MLHRCCSSHDALTLLPAVDAVLVVAEYGVTKADAAGKASDLLHRFGAPVLGVVLTNVRDHPRPDFESATPIQQPRPALQPQT